jgi:hypothetical protein
LFPPNYSQESDIKIYLKSMLGTITTCETIKKVAVNSFNALASRKGRHPQKTSITSSPSTAKDCNRYYWFYLISCKEKY